MDAVNLITKDNGRRRPLAHEVGARRAMSFQNLFALGMKRRLPELLEYEGQAFDVGASGKYVAPGATPLGAPTWVFPRDKIPAADDSAPRFTPTTSLSTSPATSRWPSSARSSGS